VATPKAEPVRRWHSVQWQTPIDGSPVVSARSDPQQQRAILVIGNLPCFGAVATIQAA
jgi:hypothetical protein